jgi:hypothetical protein
MTITRTSLCASGAVQCIYKYCSGLSLLCVDTSLVLHVQVSLTVLAVLVKDLGGGCVHSRSHLASKVLTGVFQGVS